MKFQLDLDKLSTPEQILLADPLRNSTKLLRRNMLATTMIVLVASAYGPDKINLPFTSLPAVTLFGAISCVMIYYMASFILHYASDIQAWHMAERNTLGEDRLKALKDLATGMQTTNYEIRNAASNVENHNKLFKEEIDKLVNPVLETIKNDTSTEPHRKECIFNIQNHLKALSDLAAPKSNKHNVISSAANGKYKDELLRVAGILGHFEDSVKHYEKNISQARREALQLRIMQFFIIYGWEGVFPIALSLLAFSHSCTEMLEFVKTIF